MTYKVELNGDDPICPHCKNFLEFEFVRDTDVDDDDYVETQVYFCEECQKNFELTAHFKLVFDHYYEEMEEY